MAIRSTREDFLLQELRKVAAMIARAAGLRSSGDLPAARAEIKEAYALLLGPQAALLRMLDPVSAARLVPDPKRLAALVELTDAEAELRTAEGNVAASASLRMRARSLSEEAAKLG